MYEFIALFIQNYQDCNPRWLLTGIGEMKLSSQNGDYIYGLKHTSNIMLMRKGMNIKELQAHNRHVSIETTDIYMKRMRRTDSKALKEDYPEL